VLKSIWIGAGVTSHTHYDVQHNFFVQVKGTKRFLLWPPEEADNLYLYPYLHPRALLSQVSFTAPDLTAFPRFSKTRAIVAELKAGDVLYVPPLWFHMPTATTASISVSIWTLFSEDTAYEALKKLGMPWRSGAGLYTAAEQRGMGFLYVTQLLQSEGMLTKPGASRRARDTVAKAFARTLYQQRYATLSVGLTGALVN
jgi:hypothetical protein